MNSRHHVLDLDEATARGAAMLAGMAAGVYRSADDAIASVHYQSRTFEPDPDAVTLYDILFTDIYRNLYEALRPMHHRLFDLFMESDRDQTA